MTIGILLSILAFGVWTLVRHFEKKDAEENWKKVKKLSSYTHDDMTWQSEYILNCYKDVNDGDDE